MEIEMFRELIKISINKVIIMLSSKMVIKVATFEKIKGELLLFDVELLASRQKLAELEETNRTQEKELISSKYATNHYSTGIHYLETKLQALQELATYSSESQILQYFLKNFDFSSSQLLCDSLVGYLFDGKPGIFVEFGASDGILVEPVRGWHIDLHGNRSCQISNSCVYGESNRRVRMLETPNKMLSTITDFRDFDMHTGERAFGIEYEVDTISLDDLLTLHFPDQKIDFISIDTEGTELDILTNFNFARFAIAFIAVEHNFNANRPLLRKLLVDAGYIQVFERISRWDDWWVQSNLLSRFNDSDAVQGRVGNN
jgi:FkbM family methyltransferase